jgi:hypothetical protein
MEAESGLLNLLQQHFAWYPLMQARDAYKLIYQGSMGPEHMIATRQEFARRLEAEFASLPPRREERLLEAVRADHSLFRLNLRPYKSYHQEITLLVSACLETSGLINSPVEDLINAWKIFVQFCEQGRLSFFHLEAVHQFSHWLQCAGYPTVHHSHIYRREYQPAYRLVAAQFLPGLELSGADRV